jgi:hypothetical protein
MSYADRVRYMEPAPWLSTEQRNTVNFWRKGDHQSQASAAAEVITILHEQQHITTTPQLAKAEPEERLLEGFMHSGLFLRRG